MAEKIRCIYCRVALHQTHGHWLDDSQSVTCYSSPTRGHVAASDPVNTSGNDSLAQAYANGWNNALYWVDSGRDTNDMPANPYEGADHA